MQFDCVKLNEEEELEMVVKEDPILEKAAKKLVYVSADEQLKFQLEMREAAELDYYSGLASSRDEGREEGLQEGLQKGLQEGLQTKTQEIIAEMKKEGFDDETIAKIVKLSVEDVKEIK